MTVSMMPGNPWICRRGRTRSSARRDGSTINVDR
jgi:hypothetical protein